MEREPTICENILIENSLVIFDGLELLREILLKETIICIYYDDIGVLANAHKHIGKM